MDCAYFTKESNRNEHLLAVESARMAAFASTERELPGSAVFIP